MGKKSDPPPAPNYGPLIDAMKSVSAESLELARDQFAWAKQAYTENKGVTDRVINDALETSAFNRETAKADRDRYETLFQPMEESLVRDAREFASPERAAYESGRAQADVAQKMAAARETSRRQLEGFGLDPTSTRYGALDLGSRVTDAAAQAAAGNTARERVDATGRALRSEAINVGRGYPGQIAGQFGTSLQSANQGVNAGLATTASGGSTMGTAPQYYGIGTGALGGAGNMMNMQYNNALDGYKAEQASSSGIGSALGILGGIGMKAFGFAEGGDVPDDMGSTGGAIPTSASPTSGRTVDDVPARLTAGEFVIPKDTVEWFGEKHFQTLIERSREQKKKAGAKGEAISVPPQQPTFQSRAIPV